MNPYAVIKPKQQHILRPQSRQVSLKVKPNTEINSKQILQPRASVAYSEYRQSAIQEGNKNLESQIPHVININNRKMRGFKVQIKNGQIVSKKNYQIQQKAGLKDPQVGKAKLGVQIQNSLELVVKQRQSDEFMFKLQPYHSSAQIIPVTIAENADENKNSPIQRKELVPTAAQQKKLGAAQQPKGKNYGADIQQIKSNEYIIIEKEPPKEYIYEYDPQKNQTICKVVSKEVKRYQIEQNYVKDELPIQSMNSPQKLQRSKHRHPIFTNPNAQFFQESVVLANSTSQNNQGAKIQDKYTPIHHISSPPIEKQNLNEPGYYLNGKVQEKSFYLTNQNGEL